MVIVSLVSLISSSWRVGSMYIVLLRNPKLKEKGVCAKLSDNYLFPSFTTEFSMLVVGFLISINPTITEFKTQSMIFPSSFTTIQFTVSSHTYLPVNMHKDSGSSELLSTMTFYSNLLNSFACFLFSSKFPRHAMQLTLKIMNPSEGLYGLGAVI